MQASSSSCSQEHPVQKEVFQGNPHAVLSSTIGNLGRHLVNRPIRSRDIKHTEIDEIISPTLSLSYRKCHNTTHVVLFR